MKNTKVIPIQTGIAQAFLLVQDGHFGLVDSGDRNTRQQIVRAITSRGLKMSNLGFIFLTHTHYDHAGNASELKKMSAADLIVHESEAGYLRKGFHPIPNGTGPFFRFVIFLGRHLANKTFSAFQAVEPTVLFKNHFDLHPFGFDAEIVYTPGHTHGSSTLVFNRMAFVGDTVFNLFGSKYPFVANDEVVLHKSWRLLLDLDVDFYYPAHGKRIQKADLVDAAKKRKII